MKVICLKTLVISVVLFMLNSCGTKNINQNNISTTDTHIAQNSLDWAGIYSGIMPCADCEGIEKELRLDKDSTYQLISNYLGKEATTDTLSGTFTWEGNNIRLSGMKEGEGSDKFKVEENQVKQLDMDGNEVTGELASYYILTKNGNKDVEDKRWQLIELNGKPVKGSAETHYVIFHSGNGQLEAKANCNILQLKYKIKYQFKLEIEDGLSTMMACPDNMEQEFLAALREADNLTTGDSVLSINKGRMVPLMRFKLMQ